MEVIKDDQGDQEPKREGASDGTQWKTAPRWLVTKGVLAEYLAIASKAADAAIDVAASDPVEDAARALADGFGAAMSHDRRLNTDGYDEGDFECKAHWGLPLSDEEGKEIVNVARDRT